MDFIELVGFITGIAGVWLAARENQWNWPVGIINVSIYAVVFFQNGLYGDMALQLFYIVMGFYGWYIWGKRPANDQVVIANCNIKTIAYLSLVSLVGFIIAVFFLKKTDSNVPYMDGATTVLSLTATWMMARKYIEHWLLWIIVDASYVVLYVYKQLYLTAILYVVFTLLALYGYMEWKKRMKIKTT